MKNKQPVAKQCRFSTFMVVINTRTSEFYGDLKEENLVAFLKKIDFVTQRQLETVLLNLRIRSQKSLTSLKDFKGQLERGDENHRVHWQLCLETVHKTTAKAVLEALCNALFGKDAEPSVQVLIPRDIESANAYSLKPGRLILPDSDWSTGIITKSLSDFKDRFDSDPGLKAVLENPREYQKYLLGIMENRSDDRSVYMISDFMGNTGKSRFVEAATLLGYGISVDIDEPRPMLMSVVKECELYEAKFGKEPPNVFFDMTRQVPGKYLDAFYSVLEKIKNKKVVSTFGVHNQYYWKNSPGVFVFANTPPHFSELSKDRFVVLEILSKEFNYVIRHADIQSIVIDSNATLVAYKYLSAAATAEDIRKRTGKKHFIFSDEEIRMLATKSSDYDETKETAGSCKTESEEYCEVIHNAPQKIRRMVLGMPYKKDKKSL